MTRRTTLPLLLFTLTLLLAACGSEQEAPADADAVAEETPAAAAPAAIPPRADDPSRVSPNGRAEQTLGETDVVIAFGRPFVKGRDVFGGLVPYGQVWRTGANEATVFYASGDVTINGEPLPAGAYAFFAIPGEDEWTFIFNTVAEQWGAFDYDASKDALRVKATPEVGAAQEQLTYTFEGATENTATVVLHWDAVRVPFTVAVP